MDRNDKAGVGGVPSGGHADRSWDAGSKTLPPRLRKLTYIKVPVSQEGEVAGGLRRAR